MAADIETEEVKNLVSQRAVFIGMHNIRFHEFPSEHSETLELSEV